MSRQLVRAIALVSSVATLAGCAMVRREHRAVAAPGSKPGPGVVRGKSVDLGGRRIIRHVEVTFINPTDQWIGVTGVDLVPQDGAPGPEAVVAGEDLVAWGAAMARITRINEANQAAGYTTASLVFAGVAGLGAGLGSHKIEALGAAGLVGSEVGGVASGIARTVRDGERVLMVPQAHLLAGSFRVPPGLHADRWVLFNTKTRPRDLKLKVGWSDGTASTLEINLGRTPDAPKGPTVLAP